MTSETHNFSNEEWRVPDVSTINYGSAEAVMVHQSMQNQLMYSSSSGRNSPTPPTSFVTSEVAVSVAGPYKYMPVNEDSNVRPLSRTNLQACSYESHVDITDTDAITTVSLHRCQDLVVSRYNSLLKLIGWKPFGKEHSFRHPRLWKVINVIYTTIVIALLVYSYTYNGFFCESQLHLRGLSVGKAQKLKIINLTTLIPPTSAIQTTLDLIDSQVSFKPMGLFPTEAPLHRNNEYNHSLPTNNENCSANYETIRSCHLITTCVIPSIIHALIYIYGFVHFRIKENEHLDALMERVFLQAQTTFGFQEKLIRNTRRYTWLAAIWVGLVLVLYVMSLLSFGMPHSTVYDHCSLPSYVSIILVGLDAISELLTSCVYVAVVVNYASQCEFLLHSIHHICLQLHERQLNLKQAMHEILGVRDQLSQLNGVLAKMTSLCVLNFGVVFVIGFCLLIMNFELTAEQWICRTIFLVSWLFILLAPVIQAARMTKMGEKLRQISFEIRVFGYKSCSQLDLDSFILFVSNATLRTKLFSVPVKPAYLVSSIAILTFALLLLFQTDTIQTNMPDIF